MLSLLGDHYPALVAAIAGLGLIFWPPPKRSGVEAERQARLRELAAGAEENYLDERRALEAYGPASAGPFRFWGVLLLLLSLAIMLL